ncbi:diaminobutyrate acetyltransferase [Vibrio mangrovi]|uniref:L-2,4-diaminobutyric acid acetyltransferase n=1 Tax=Vibrio mangrovi TaxID=474394 RepID=A0A1Y6IZ97_9VIBR|nr:diaminobutyrate acetyltransferase [Vibrio mangrovi]MDW6005093.1 diaminobutyrate acetyltransferase [Vibrio mangrovi]SMS02984.1 L-2,4-diaminobutyric acid acetyltransferase [Vibrio mangrovi]
MITNTRCSDVALAISESQNSTWVLRTPIRSDGQRVHELVSLCPPLDENSAYCNFLQSIHFQKTCILAEQHNDVLGFISAYRKPDCSSELFIWQVAVHPAARGKGLAFEMLNALVSQAHLHDIEAIETTITKDNQGSWSLFKKFDRSFGLQGQVSTFLDETRHFDGQHETEYLYRIPLKSMSQK